MTDGARVVTAGGGQPPDDHLEQRVAAIEAVLPTLATKADLAEMRAEIRLENQRLAESVRAEHSKLENAILQRLTVMQAKWHADAQAMHASLFR